MLRLCHPTACHGATAGVCRFILWKGWTVSLDWILPGTIEHANTVLKSGKLGDLMLYECWMQRRLGRILKESSYREYEQPKRPDDTGGSLTISPGK